MGSLNGCLLYFTIDHKNLYVIDYRRGTAIFQDNISIILYIRFMWSILYINHPKFFANFEDKVL